MIPYAKIFGNLSPANRSSLQRKDLANKIMATWSETQGAKILEARGKLIFGFCRMEARDRANYLAMYEDSPRLLFDLESIELCESRAVSQARMVAFGASALRRTDQPGRGAREAEKARAMLKAGIWPEGRA